MYNKCIFILNKPFLIKNGRNFICTGAITDLNRYNLLRSFSNRSVTKNFICKVIGPGDHTNCQKNHQNINDNISYSITLNDFGALEITLEAVIPANTDINFGGINLNLGVNLYQRLIVTIKPNRLPPPSNNGVISEIAIPLYKPESEILPNDVVIKNMKYVNYISLIAVALLTGMKVISTTLASTASGPLSILLALVFFILR